MRYDDSRADAYDTRYAARFAEAGATAAFLAGVSRPAGRVLELGVGTGRLALLLAEQGLDVAGVDDDGAQLQATTHDPVAQVVRGQTMTISAAGVELWPFEIRYATPAEIDLMARLAGLRLRERWGGWAGEPFTGYSTRHVSVYERPS